MADSKYVKNNIAVIDSYSGDVISRSCTILYAEGSQKPEKIIIETDTGGLILPAANIRQVDDICVVVDTNRKAREASDRLSGMFPAQQKSEDRSDPFDLLSSLDDFSFFDDLLESEPEKKTPILQRNDDFGASLIDRPRYEGPSAEDLYKELSLLSASQPGSSRAEAPARRPAPMQQKVAPSKERKPAEPSESRSVRTQVREKPTEEKRIKEKIKSSEKQSGAVSASGSVKQTAKPGSKQPKAEETKKNAKKQIKQNPPAEDEPDDPDKKNNKDDAKKERREKLHRKLSGADLAPLTSFRRRVLEQFIGAVILGMLFTSLRSLGLM